MVIWIIGKSGTGKTFFARKLYKELIRRNRKVFWIDGDEFRKFISYDLKYTTKERKINSGRIQDFCKYLEFKKYLVICSILSIFKQDQKKNRKIFKNYKQIYIKAEQKTLVKRNNKKIYSNKKNVVGKDIIFPKPYKSDLIIENNFRKQDQNIKNILNLINEKK
tara:strand:+ start:212 stop:703 length:492 start_codon:yes stop_codon:yes gene_type:complete